MFTLLSAFSMVIIASCQCFHVFKCYRKLIELELLINRLICDGVVLKFKDKEIIGKPHGANRNVRTVEQKAKASAKRKAWWDKKRAQEAKPPEPIQQPKQN